ncbi:hypothetical protein OC834_007855 [Tilletia horrida]|uniref:Uncharacterized protein n=1 Tax=Tilletia horrida TaxID=155126 RepID=A0AAN6JGB9_9BASI|nr:hypothetical protein OC834_007855 [Tilletia horrida]KAK0518113.1 hypothetical protein OC835_007949 [Tilletia horrida]KAK0518114.1 hypothetical protein OC842_007893 [Tilletia horrida]
MVDIPQDLKNALEEQARRRRPRRAAAAAAGAGPQAAAVQHCQIGQIGVQVAGLQRLVDDARAQDGEIERLRRLVAELQDARARDAEALFARARKIRRLQARVRDLERNEDDAPDVGEAILAAEAAAADPPGLDARVAALERGVANIAAAVGQLLDVQAQRRGAGGLAARIRGIFRYRPY